jgi:hypothetical protein
MAGTSGIFGIVGTGGVPGTAFFFNILPAPYCNFGGGIPPHIYNTKAFLKTARP